MRGIDDRGSGQAVVTIEQICLALQCGQSTVYRWLKDGSSTWFRAWENLGKGVLRIFYRSILKVCAEFQISDLGAIGIVNPADLTRSGRKVRSAELEAQLAQHQAYYATFKSLDKQEARKLTKPEKVFSSTSELSAGEKGGRDFFKIRPDAPIVPHTTIEKVSNRLGKSWSTAQRRLSNQWRDKKGFEALDRKQVLRRFDEGETQAYKAALQGNFDSGRSGYNLKTKSFQRIILLGGAYFWMGGNVYNFSRGLKNSRHQRSRVRRSTVGSNALA